MYICLQAWGLQLRLKVRSVYVYVCVRWGLTDGGGRGGEGWVESLLQPRVGCEMKADGFMHLMPGIRRSESRTQNPSDFLEQLFQLLIAKLYAVVLKYSCRLRPLNI